MLLKSILIGFLSLAALAAIGASTAHSETVIVRWENHTRWSYDVQFSVKSICMDADERPFTVAGFKHKTRLLDISDCSSSEKPNITWQLSQDEDRGFELLALVTYGKPQASKARVQIRYSEDPENIAFITALCGRKKCTKEEVPDSARHGHYHVKISVPAVHIPASKIPIAMRFG